LPGGGPYGHDWGDDLPEVVDVTETTPEQIGINRRQALKRIAAGGAVLWTIPAVQTLNMRRAFAVGSPGEECYTIKLDPCEAPSPNTNLEQAYGCLFDFDPDVIVTDQPESEACSKVANFTSNGTWTVTLAAGCHLEAGFSKCGSGDGSCEPSPSPNGSTGTIQFVPCDNGAEISHVEFTICCEPVP
jgi:hypothetical protein